MKLCSIVSNAFLKSKKEYIRHPQSIHDSLKYLALGGGISKRREKPFSHQKKRTSDCKSLLYLFIDLLFK